MHLSELESLSYGAAFFRHSNCYYQTIYIKVVLTVHLRTYHFAMYSFTQRYRIHYNTSIKFNN